MFLPLLISFGVVKTFRIQPQVFRLNCKFKFHFQAALHRGAARRGRAYLRSRRGAAGPAGSAEVGEPAGVPEEALPGRWAPPDWAGLPAVPIRRCRAGGLR